MSVALTFYSFIYGGATEPQIDMNNPTDTNYTSVYVLSTPAFQWFRSSSVPTTVRRANHECVVIGNRQMISIGGAQPSSPDSLGQDDDPWPNGIGLFDMTAFEWVGQYTADAAEYDSPNAVKEYYASSHSTPVWSTPTLAEIFGSNGSQPFSPSSSQDFSGGRGTDTGSIAGAVVGGVVGVAIVVIVGLCILRKRKQQERHHAEEMTLGALPPYDKPQQLDSKYLSPASELPSGIQTPVEMGNGVDEQGTHSRFAELASETEGR